jgi:hypothetical protein
VQRQAKQSVPEAAERGEIAIEFQEHYIKVLQDGTSRRLVRRF